MFKRRTLASTIALASLGVFPSFVFAQDDVDASGIMIDEIIVRGVRGSLTEAMNLKRQNVQVVDSVVAEDIGKFPDNNVVEALQRVPGVQVTGRGGGEVSIVNIRGLTDYSTTVNGRQIYTSVGRNIALADIPADLLAGVDVHKTRSADLIEGGIAGLVAVRTRRPLDFDSTKFTFSARGTSTSNVDETDPSINALFSTRWDAGDQEFGILANLSYKEINFRDDNLWTGIVLPLDGTATDGVGEAGWETRAHFYLDDSFWTPGVPLSAAEGQTVTNGTETIEYGLLRDFMGAWNTFGKRERPAAVLSFQWRPTQNLDLYSEIFYNGFKGEDSNSLLQVDMGSWGHTGEWAFFDGTNVIKENYIFNPGAFTSTQARTGETDSFQYAVGGKWQINEVFFAKSELLYQTSTYSWYNQIQDFNRRAYAATDLDSNGNPMGAESWMWNLAADFSSESGYPALEFFNFIDPALETDPIDESDLTNPELWVLSAYFDQVGEDEGSSVSWNADFEWDVDVAGFTTIDFGVRFDQRDATSYGVSNFSNVCLTDCIVAENPGLYTTSPDDFFDNKTVFPEAWLIADKDYLLAHPEESRVRYGFDAPVQVLNFDASESTTAFYGQVNFEYDVGMESRFDGQVGFRAVNSSVDVLGSSGLETSESRSDLLPSALFRYMFTEDLMARLAFGKTIKRPEFWQLNPTFNVVIAAGDSYGIANSGNPGLKSVESTNVDLALEWYFTESSSVYGTLFRRDIDGFVFNGKQILDFDGGSYIVNMPLNSGKGEINGLELGFQFFPDFVPDWLKGIGVQGNYTYIDGETEDPIFSDDGENISVEYVSRPIQGVSENAYSLVLAYEKGPIGARLSYVSRDSFRVADNTCCNASPNTLYSEGESSMDFQVSWDIIESLTVSFDATNITGEVYKEYYGDPDVYNANNFLFGSKYSLGIRYQM